MRKHGLLLTLVAVLLTPAAAIGQSKFDGTWKIDLKKAQPSQKPRIFLLENGVFSCKTCVPSYSVKADGQYHQLPPNPYVDQMAVKLVSAGKAEATQTKNGKVVRTLSLTASPDGKTLAITFNDSTATSADPVTGTTTLKQVAAGPPGSDPISGSWAPAKFTQSDNGLTFTLKIEDDSVTMNSPTGQSYTAKLDGTDAPFKGDPGVTSVSVKRIGNNTIEETDKRDGKAIYVTSMAVSADGKTMTLTEHDLQAQRISRDTAIKQ